MSKDLELRLRLTATDRNVAGTVRNTKKEVQGLAGTLGTVSRASRSTAQGMAGVTTAGEEANRMFRLQKGALQQAGYQFQDFFVQVGSGTSAFVALGQQGSQLLSLLGPGGALLGAVLAIGSVIGGTLVRTLGEGEEATSGLAEKMRELAKELGHVSDRQREIIDTGYAQTIAQQRSLIEEQRQRIYEASRTMETFVRRLSEQEKQALESNGSLDRFKNTIEDARNQIAIAEGTIKATKKEQEEFWKEIDKGSDAAQQQRDELDSLVKSVESQAATIGKTNREIALYEASLLNAGEAELEAINRAYDAIEAEKARQAGLKASAEAAKEWSRAQLSAEQDLNVLMDRIDPLGAELRSLTGDIQVVQAAFERGLITAEQADTIVNNLVDPVDEASKKAAEQFANRFETAAGRVSQAVQDAIVSGEWDTIGEAIGNTLASSISSIIDDSITRSLARGVTANSGLSQQLSAAFAGPIIGAVAGGAIALALREIDDYVSDNWDPTAARQAAQGTGTVLGDISAKSESIRRAVEGSESGIGQLVGINQGMLNALKNLQSGISGATTRIARGSGDISISAPGVMSARDLFSGATGGVLPVFDETLSAAFDFFDEMGEILTFGLLDLGSLLGGKTKKRDEGIQIIGGYISDLIDETVVNAYATFRVKKHAFDDYDTKERFQRIGGDVERQFSAVFASLFDTVLEAGVAIGYDEQAVADALNQGRIGTARISLEGLSAEQQQAELEAYFSSLFDDMAGGLFPFIEEFQVAGEGLGETLVRVANYVQITEEAVNRLGLQFSNLTGRDLVEASERLMEAAGGIEQFITSMQGFIDRFASDARQFELAQSDLTRALERAGLQLPATRQGYYDLLQAQDAATASGAENVALLLRLQDVADTYYTRLEDYQAELIRKQADLIRQQRATVADSLREAEQVADAIRNALTGLSHSIDRPAAIARDEAERYLRSIVRRGVVTDRDDFDAAVSSLVDIRAADFASFSDYLRAVSKAGTLLGELDAVAQSRVSVEQSMLSQLEKQVELIERGNSEQLAALRALQSTVESSAVSFNQVNRVTQVDNGSVNYGGGMTREVAEAVNRLRTELVDVQRSIERYSQRTSRILERIEQDGVEIRA